MKKILLIITLFISVHCLAQQQLAFPFQGGSTAMTQFFRDSLKVSPDIIRAKASGIVIFKFSVDGKGAIKNVVIYYADDAILAPPAIDALKKSNKKWIIPDPDHEKLHDFILPFMISFNAGDNTDRDTQNQQLNFYAKHKPILSHDQIPLNFTTLLPAVVVKYDAGQ
ncbi:MAG: hypothetical protein ACHQHN_07710 [Sphingobacteriales bacterium]